MLMEGHYICGLPHSNLQDSQLINAELNVHTCVRTERKKEKDSTHNLRLLPALETRRDSYNIKDFLLFKFFMNWLSLPRGFVSLFEHNELDFISSPLIILHIGFETSIYTTPFYLCVIFCFALVVMLLW